MRGRISVRHRPPFRMVDLNGGGCANVGSIHLLVFFKLYARFHFPAFTNGLLVSQSWLYFFLCAQVEMNGFAVSSCCRPSKKEAWERQRLWRIWPEFPGAGVGHVGNQDGPAQGFHLYRRRAVAEVSGSFLEPGCVVKMSNRIPDQNG